MTTEVKRFPIVGVGASAGGIPALEALFKGLETVSDMAFVIVTHLNPDRQSLLHEVITRYTRMPVSVTQNGERVESGHVYVMPENSILTIEDGRLQMLQRFTQDKLSNSPSGDPAVEIFNADGALAKAFNAKAGKVLTELTPAQIAELQQSRESLAVIRASAPQLKPKPKNAASA